MIRVQWLDDIKNMMFDNVAVEEIIEEHGESILRRGSNTIIASYSAAEIIVKISNVVEVLDAKDNKEPMTIVYCRIKNVKLL